MGEAAEMTKPQTVAAPRPGEQTFDVRLRALIWEAPGVMSLEIA